jgi:hypothetical protein
LLFIFVQFQFQKNLNIEGSSNVQINFYALSLGVEDINTSNIAQIKLVPKEKLFEIVIYICTISISKESEHRRIVKRSNQFLRPFPWGGRHQHLKYCSDQVGSKGKVV